MQMKLNPDLVLRQIGDEYMIVNPFTDTVDMTDVYTLNESAAWLWLQLEGKSFTQSDLVSLLQTEYDVDTETARADIDELCNHWLSSGLAFAAE